MKILIQWSLRSKKNPIWDSDGQDFYDSFESVSLHVRLYAIKREEKLGSRPDDLTVQYDYPGLIFKMSNYFELV